jgi:tripartite motif-containing protein 71
MLIARRMRRRGSPPSLLAPALLTLALTLAPTPLAARAAAGEPGGPCAGSGASSCPYASVQIVGQRGEGVLRFPEAVAVDAQGDVYVADQLGYEVQEFTAAGQFETEWGAYGGGPGQFGPIAGLATDAAGNVYVVDSSHNRIEKFTANGEFLTQWGHKGSELGEFKFGSSQDYTQPPGGGIAVAGNYVYVADSGNDRIERFNLEGGEATQWGSYGSGPGQFSYPRGVAANESEVIVSDDDNHRLEKFSPEGAYEGTVDEYSKNPVQFGFPYGVALDAAGDVYVADDINARVVKLGPQLNLLAAWGSFGSKPGQLAFPRALASDPAGDTYVADTANDRIEVFDPNGTYLRTLGDSAYGPGIVTAPRGLAVDPTGRLLVSDTDGNRIEAFAPGSDAYAGEWAAAGGYHSGFYMPAGIAVDPRGSVYVADVGDQRLVRLWGEGTFLSELAGPADRGGAGLNDAGSVAVAAGPDETYVADTGHNRVLVYGPEGSLRAKWGADEAEGEAGSGTGEFDEPDAVAVDGAGDAYVADTANNRIVELGPEGTVLREWGSLGSADGLFHEPTGVAVDGAGNVYVVDRENNRVQEFDSEGRFLAKWGTRGVGPGEFSQPSAVAVDCNGDVYVADTNNNRVERFNPVIPAVVGCLAPEAWPPPLDVAPTVNVSVPQPTGVLARRALALAVSCRRACKVLVTATLVPLGRSGGSPPNVPLVAAARPLRPGQTTPLRLRVGPLALARLRRALGNHDVMKARVSIIAAGPTGRRTSITKTYVVSR